MVSSPVSSSSPSDPGQKPPAEEKYTPVLKKFSGSGGWPEQAVILPGHEILFSLETASDYIKDEKVGVDC